MRIQIRVACKLGTGDADDAMRCDVWTAAEREKKMKGKRRSMFQSSVATMDYLVRPWREKEETERTRREVGIDGGVTGWKARGESRGAMLISLARFRSWPSRVLAAPHLAKAACRTAKRRLHIRWPA
jgi:hypothetical protein